MDLTDKKQLN